MNSEGVFAMKTQRRGVGTALVAGPAPGAVGSSSHDIDRYTERWTSRTRLRPRVDGVTWQRLGIVVDIAVPVAIVAGVFAQSPAAWLWGAVGAAVMGLGLGLRRRRPLVAVALATAAQTGLLWLDAPAAGAVGVGVCLFSACSQVPWRLAVPVSIGSVAVLAVAEVLSSRYLGTEAPNLVAVVLLFAVGVASGLAVANYRAYAAAADARALDAARHAAAEMNQHLAEERLALARDLHDSIGHHLAVANIQTGVARATARRDLDACQAALDHAAHATQAAMAELSQLVTALREQRTHLTPPGDDHRPGSVEDLDMHGVTVAGTASLDGLAPSVADGCYRVIQEGLTNARKHAPGSPIVLDVTRTDTAVEIRLVNDLLPSATPTSGGGFGLTGLTERVRALDGTLVTQRVDGCFELTATIPLRGGTA